ncbi:MAG: nucleotidyltransferase family protein [Candidatus Altiarchaeia archaeon]
MKIIIVAGGLATRMRPYTDSIPKCMVDINGKPLIAHQLEYFRDCGYTDYIFCIGHLAEKVREFFGDGSSLGIKIEYVQEKDALLGTAGSVKSAEPLLAGEDDFIVYYGDNLTSMDLGRFISFHKKRGGIATLAVRLLPPGYKSSSLISLDENGKITNYLEKPSIGEIAKYAKEKCYINSGIYVLKRGALAHIPKGEKYDFSMQLFPRLIDDGLGLYGYQSTEFFREIGRPEKYAACKEECAGKKDLFK